MRLLKRVSMDSEGLKTLYVATIKSVVAYASRPAWYNLLSDTDKTRLVRIQRFATQIILPFSDDLEQRLDNLTLPTISTFLHNSCNQHFTKIANDNHNPLNTRNFVDTNRTSARRAKIDRYRPSISAEPLRDKRPFLNSICDFSTFVAQTPFYFIFRLLCRSLDALNLPQVGYLETG